MYKIFCLFVIITINLTNYKQLSSKIEKSENNSNSVEKIDSNDFFYANTKRYSLTGNLPNKNTDTDYLSFASLTLGTAAFMWGQYVYQKNTIWEEETDFKVYEDGLYALNADKAGHVFGTYYVSYLYTEAYSLTGISWEVSNILGATTGLLYTTYVEVMDGYAASNFGFSPSDFYADIAGASFYLLQYYVPYLQNFTPKFMYFPANWHGDHKRRPHFAFIDDYSSHTLWLSMNIHNMLPDDLSKYWPDWLQLSVGYAARNLCDPFDPEFNCEDIPMANGFVRGERKYIIALDYNLVKALPELGPPFDWIVQSLNYIKWPSPAIEFGNETRFSLVYPFVTF